MKKRIIIVIIIAIFGLLGWMGYISVQSLKDKEAKTMLTGSLTKMFESLNVQAPTPSGTTMLIYFNSECEHCQWEVKQLGDNLDRFADINLALVSLEPADSAIQFLKEHSMAQFFIKTRPEDIMNTFSGGVPQLFIYEGDELKKQFRGEVKVETLLEAFNKN